MSTSPLIKASDGGATWPWLTSLAGLTAPARPPGFPRIATRTPGTDLAAVRAARAFTRATLQRWELADRCDDITLVVSELLTNALEHAAPRPGGWPVRIGLLQSRPGAAVLCAVADPSAAPPVPVPPGHLAESGRGLHVIEEISDSWGYTTARRRGKVVWATFEPAAGSLRAVPAGSASTAESARPATPASTGVPAVPAR
jgi:anti-sigma regulatory factor (Ser/Thr protein kinase)